MARGPALSEDSKISLKEQLRQECECSWVAYGYKKTNIKGLCTKLGIGIGTFYMLYPTKEDLFIDTLDEIQRALNERFFGAILEREPNKEGFAKAFKDLQREYSEKPFLYRTNSEDFISFSSKLPEDKLEKLQYDNAAFFQESIERANLTLKTSKEIAFSVFNALLVAPSSQEMRSSYSCDSKVFFEFMLDNLINDIFGKWYKT